ncbi:hypothetical protein, conserved [Trypanosoma brucei gambiense DAL972]|uniref:GRIP domain-containing protein n=1 Tax=Trypanosoma brucei gambiense (strain MHOM/CI/86/DAL972) TaxID=679716 RepID=D0A7P4_TRYB9|nr:hypothetical protein, conserved [Trypanosoma brucei gambiense DAL972]CBH17695.1 hypothetical protein, conserved [Trypanosoma brucei gambiense DAL972]|eukprot:XP_011779959.1 hypothetical protein, conserved [Trypanosoma brucei gambiense DAL972]
MAAEDQGASPSSHRGEVDALRDRVTAMRETIESLGNDLAGEKLKYATLHDKVVAWKEKIKQKTLEDRLRISQLEEELSAVRKKHQLATSAAQLDVQKSGGGNHHNLESVEPQEAVHEQLMQIGKDEEASELLKEGRAPSQECLREGEEEEALIERKIEPKHQGAQVPEGHPFQQAALVGSMVKELRKANETLRADLGEASRFVEAARSEAEQLKKGLCSTKEEDELRIADLREELDALRCQLENTTSKLEAEVDANRKLFRRCNDAEERCEHLLHEKEIDKRMYEEKLVEWREIFQVAKAKDESTIDELRTSLCTSRCYLKQLCHTVLAFLGCECDNPLEVIGDEFAERLVNVSLFSQRLDSFRKLLVERAKSCCVVCDADSILQVFELICSSIEGVRSERDVAAAELDKSRQMISDARSQLALLEAKCSSLVSPDVVAGLEARNIQLEEKCELLRREIKRQREAFQRERDLQESMVATAPLQGVAAARVPSDGVFERGMLSLAAQQSQRDNEIRQLQANVQALERENAVLRRECDHNNSVVAQFTKEMEVLKTKERVQLSVEYVRNVVLQYLCCSCEEMRMKMVPAIATVLEFTAKEKRDVQSANPQCPPLK